MFISDDRLAELIDNGGEGLRPGEAAIIAAELLARRARRPASIAFRDIPSYLLDLGSSLDAKIPGTQSSMQEDKPAGDTDSEPPAWVKPV